MNFGAFAGGFSGGFNQGVSMAKTIRDVIKDRKLQDLREQGMAEAEAQRAKTAADMIKEGGMTGEAAPASGPVDKETPKVETPDQAAAVSAASPTANPDAAGAATAAAPYQGVVVTPIREPGMPEAPTASPDAAGAATASGTYAPPSVSTQAPAPDAKAPAVVQPSAAQAAPATPQTVAATGVAKKANGKFTVNGESYDTREQAMAAAEKAAPSATDLFMKNTVPKLAAQYVINGEPEKAKAWTDYAESVNGKRAIKDWAAAYSAPDMDTAVSKFGKYYTDHINDGVDYTGHKLLQKADGSQVAVVTLKDKATGKSIEMELTREKMLALGGANNPQKLFEQEVAKQSAAEKMKFEAGLKAQERKAKREDDLYMEGVKAGSTRKLEEFKQDRLDQREGLKSDREVTRENAKVNAKIDAQVNSLRDAGYGDDEIKRMMPALVGAGDHKKTTDPTERRALIASDLLKNDPRFGRMEKAEQNKRIDDMMGVIYGEEKPAAAKQSGAAVSDKPMAYNKDLPVKYQKGTGKPFHLVDGKYVPIEGTVPPAAAGMPKR
jgi:hypothetical protein